MPGKNSEYLTNEPNEILCILDKSLLVLKEINTLNFRLITVNTPLLVNLISHCNLSMGNTSFKTIYNSFHTNKLGINSIT